MKKNTIIASFVILALPVMAIAAGDLGTTIGNIGKYVNSLIPIAVALAVLFFFFGLAKYILNAGNEDKKSEGRSIMIWGIIALFIMVSIWGLISLFAQSLGVKEDKGLNVPDITLPTVKDGRSGGR